MPSFPSFRYNFLNAGDLRIGAAAQRIALEMAVTESVLAPLRLLLMAMNEHWEAGRSREAIAVAAIAAPYVHGKAPREEGARGLQQLTDSQIDELYAVACTKRGKAKAAS